jgi:enoyl-CoA hydratase
VTIHDPVTPTTAPWLLSPATQCPGDLLSDIVKAMTAVQVHRTGDVAEIVLSRPEQYNAMNMAWVADMADAVAELERNKPGIVVVRGEGRVFCAGLDLNMLAAEGMPVGFYEQQEQAFVGLERLDRLVVAQIHSYCLGGGLQLALACDIRILSEDAVLGLPAAHEGLPPGMATWRLPRFVGLGRAMRLAVGGERFHAEEALAIGLADHVLPADGFREAAAELVARYLAVPQDAARATKELVRSAFDTDFATAYARSRELVAQCLAGPDVAAAREAWRTRR